MPAINPPVLGGGSTLTQSTMTFDPTETSGVPNNFGLAGGKVDVTSGGANTFGGAAAIGTATADLDGMIFSIDNQSRAGALHVYFNGLRACEAIPFNANSGTNINLPIRVPSGTVVTAEIASTTSATFYVTVLAYQCDAASEVTSIKALAAYSTISTQGVALSSAGTWTEVGTLAADAKGIAAIIVNNNNVGSRTAGEILVGVGAGGSGSEQILVPNMKYLSSSSLVVGPLFGPYLMDLPNGTRIVARAEMLDGSLPNAVNIQVAVMY